MLLFVKQTVLHPKQRDMVGERRAHQRANVGQPTSPGWTSAAFLSVIYVYFHHPALESVLSRRWLK